MEHHARGCGGVAGRRGWVAVGYLRDSRDEIVEGVGQQSIAMRLALVAPREDCADDDTGLSDEVCVVVVIVLGLGGRFEKGPPITMSTIRRRRVAPGRAGSARG